MVFVGILMTYYLFSVARATREARSLSATVNNGRRYAGPSRLQAWWSNPWGKPRFLVLFTWAYMLWSLVPVAIAVLFGFNAGRSRSAWQGFSLRWYYQDPDLSVLHDPSLRAALVQSLKLAGLTMLIATPLGVALAIGLARWRGWGARPANFLMLFPLVTPEIVMGVALFLVFVTSSASCSSGRRPRCSGT